MIRDSRSGLKLKSGAGAEVAATGPGLPEGTLDGSNIRDDLVSAQHPQRISGGLLTD